MKLYLIKNLENQHVSNKEQLQTNSEIADRQITVLVEHNQHILHWRNNLTILNWKNSKYEHSQNESSTKKNNSMKPIKQ